ncbi:MAG: hypothetical protein Q8R37_05705 [Nanoarchaeota archaeon]|nr:hypothetical protein [Nanoarchaeota archaeon]
MITKGNCWVWSIREENKLADSSSSGKWLLSGSVEYLATLFHSIDQLVEKGTIFRAKYSHKENPWHESLPENPPVLVVYADDTTRDQTLEELAQLGITPSSWKYDAETDKDWENNGKLSQESERQRLRLFFREIYGHIQEESNATKK